MTIQYPGKLDKKRKVYVTMDNTSSQNNTICRTIINTLKAGGLNVQEKSTISAHIGPNKFAEQYVSIYNRGESDVILVGFINGVDPTNIKEVGLQYFDNRGTKFRKLGNDVILAAFYDSCDCVRPGGSCYEKVKLRNPQTDVPTGGYFYHPAQYADENKIYLVNQSSDSHNHPENADYTGEKVARAVVDLFESGSSNQEQTTPTENTDNTNNTNNTDTTGKTITSRTITKHYQIPFYEKVFKAATDLNGAFKLLPVLPYQGEYNVTMKFVGDKTHNGTTRTIKIKNYNSKSAIGKETLLKTVTFTKYSDGTSSTTDTGGKIPDNVHIRREIVTETYTNGVLSKTSTHSVYVDNILIENTTPNSDDVPVTPQDTEVTPVDDSTKVNPFNQVVNTVNGVPNVAKMQANGKNFVMWDTTRTYTLTLAQYQAVYYRDSKGMQLNNYKLSKYIAFESTDSSTYNVVEREVWNFVTESVHQWHVRHNGANWPSSYVIDPANRKTKVGSEWVSWKGTAQGITNGKCTLYVVGDAQNTGYTCGPTSASVCSQYLMNYYSESTMAKKAGTTSSGTGPEGIARTVNLKNMKGYVFSNEKTAQSRAEAIAWMNAGKPVVWHISGHYMAFVLINEHNGKILVLNSSSGVQNDRWIDGGRLSTGWQPQSNVTNSYGGHVKIELNWTISATEVQQINNLFKSMGGAWTRPASTASETVRRY